MDIQVSNTRIFCALLGLVVGLSAGAADIPKTWDGMALVGDTKMRAVYQSDGASLAQYRRIALVDCHVAFKKNWQRDHNRQEGIANFAGKVTDQDMARIKGDVASEFRSEFTKVLEKGGYDVVDSHTAAADVLIVRPAIVNLDVTAPVDQGGFNRSYTTTAGTMTLYMELYDSVSSAILYRVIDAQAARTLGGRATRASNKQAADAVLRDWAQLLADHLTAVKGK